MTATEYVVLVDKHDQPTGRAEKMLAHQQGLLHRAFSVLVFKEPALPITGDSLLLLQQRALDKYHSPGLWTNTCCSHPREGEDIVLAGERRLHDELGFSTPLKHIGYFHYTAHFPNGLIENELDHVLVGSIDDDVTIKPVPSEVAATRWISVTDLQTELAADPSRFTPWIGQALAIVLDNALLIRS